MTSLKRSSTGPPAAQKTYNQLYALYRQLHDSFGGLNKSADLSRVMKELLASSRSSRPDRPPSFPSGHPPRLQFPLLPTRYSLPLLTSLRYFMKLLATPEIWFVTGSQHLYGPGPLKQVAANSKEDRRRAQRLEAPPAQVVFKALLTTPDEIRALCLEANHDPTAPASSSGCTRSRRRRCGSAASPRCASPSSTCTRSSTATCRGRDRHGFHEPQPGRPRRPRGRVHPHPHAPGRKVVVGHWQDPEVQDRLGAWMRAARAWHDWQGAKFARFGDNMRQVAVTEGDKVAAEMRSVSPSTATASATSSPNRPTRHRRPGHRRAVRRIRGRYTVAKELRKGGARHESLRYGARIELGLRAFLEGGGFKGFTTTFEDLHGLRQLPGLAVQRLMADGYGFGAEGDWKTCALLRAMKVMGAGLKGGTSFMEDYTYHSEPEGPPGARRAHARDLRVDRRHQALARNPSARHRRQGGSGAPRVRRPPARRSTPRSSTWATASA
jgi:hypothetical protein